MKSIRCAMAAGLAAILFGGAASAATTKSSFADAVRAANDRFQNPSVATSEGYAPLPCASGADGGSMGIHYVNPKLIGDAAPNIAHPAAVMYEPQADGSMALIGVEFITTKGPASLGGQLFNFAGSPNRYGLGPYYELHVWAWRDNPMGTFADMNPNVSCDATPMPK